MAILKMPKKLPKSDIKKRFDDKILVKLTPAEAKANSLLDDQSGGSYDQESPHVSLKYFNDNFECFSHWEKAELKEFSDFLQQLRKRTWRDVLSTSGGASKRGLAYTPYDIAKVSDGIRSCFDDVKNADLRRHHVL